MATSIRHVGELLHGPGAGAYRVVATGSGTGGHHFAMEVTEAPGGGPPLHVHTREDEFFYVTEGEFSFWVGGEVIRVAVGGTAFGPRGIPHTFRNCSGSPAKMLVICTPSDIEGFFDYGLPLDDGSVPDDGVLIERIMRLAPGYGLEMLGPSPLPDPPA